MKESDLNRYIVNNYRNTYWGYKIPDPPKIVATTSAERPFDLITISDKYFLFGETKLLKHKYQAFSFSKIREHQLFHLNKINDTLLNQGIYYFAAIIIGIWIPRKSIDLYFFDISLINHLIERGRKSILKKDFDKLKENNLYIKMNLKEHKFPIDELMTKFIREREFYEKTK